LLLRRTDSYGEIILLVFGALYELLEGGWTAIEVFEMDEGEWVGSRPFLEDRPITTILLSSERTLCARYGARTKMAIYWVGIVVS
jgi:hypothetical protein